MKNVSSKSFTNYYNGMVVTADPIDTIIYVMNKRCELVASDIVWNTKRETNLFDDLDSDDFYRFTKDVPRDFAFAMAHKPFHNMFLECHGEDEKESLLISNANKKHDKEIIANITSDDLIHWQELYKVKDKFKQPWMKVGLEMMTATDEEIDTWFYGWSKTYTYEFPVKRKPDPKWDAWCDLFNEDAFQHVDPEAIKVLQDSTQQVLTVAWERDEDDPECTVTLSGFNSWEYVSPKRDVTTVPSKLCPSRRRHATTVYIVSECDDSVMIAMDTIQHKGCTWFNIRMVGDEEKATFFTYNSNRVQRMYSLPPAQDDFEAQLAAFDANTKAQQDQASLDELDKLLSEL